MDQNLSKIWQQSMDAVPEQNNIVCFKGNDSKPSNTFRIVFFAVPNGESKWVKWKFIVLLIALEALISRTEYYSSIRSIISVILSFVVPFDDD